MRSDISSPASPTLASPARRTLGRQRRERGRGRRCRARPHCPDALAPPSRQHSRPEYNSVGIGVVIAGAKSSSPRILPAFCRRPAWSRWKSRWPGTSTLCNASPHLSCATVPAKWRPATASIRRRNVAPCKPGSCLHRHRYRRRDPRHPAYTEVAARQWFLGRSLLSPAQPMRTPSSGFSS